MSSVKITWLGHATFQMELDGKIIIVDPWLEGNPAYPGSHMHFGTFPPLVGRPEHLRQQLQDQPQIEVVALEPGQSLEW